MRNEGNLELPVLSYIRREVP